MILDTNKNTYLCRVAPIVAKTPAVCKEKGALQNANTHILQRTPEKTICKPSMTAPLCFLAGLSHAFLDWSIHIFCSNPIALLHIIFNRCQNQFISRVCGLLFSPVSRRFLHPPSLAQWSACIQRSLRFRFSSNCSSIITLRPSTQQYCSRAFVFPCSIRSSPTYPFCCHC